MGLDDGAARADGRVPLGAGKRAPLLQRDLGSAARPLGLRMGAAQHHRHPERRLRRTDGTAARPPRPRRARLGRRRRAGKSGKRRVWGGRGALRRRHPRGPAQRRLALLPGVGAVHAHDRRSAGDADSGRWFAAAAARTLLGRLAPAQRDAPLELPGRVLLDDSGRAVDERADRAGRGWLGRGLLLPRHARRQGDAHGLGAGHDRGDERADRGGRRSRAHRRDAGVARGESARRDEIHCEGDRLVRERRSGRRRLERRTDVARHSGPRAGGRHNVPGGPRARRRNRHGDRRWLAGRVGRRRRATCLHAPAAR